MNIKLKVKHLIFMILGIIALFAFTIFIIQPQVSIFVAKKKIERGDITGKEDLKKILDNHSFSLQKWGIIRDYMLEEGFFYPFNVIVGPSFTQESDTPMEARFSPAEKIPYLTEYIQGGPVNGYLSTAAKQLASYYSQKGEIEKAYNALEKTAERFSINDSWERNDLLLERARIASKQRDFTNATQFINELMTDHTVREDVHFLAELTELKAKNLALQGDIEGALEVINKAIDNKHRSSDYAVNEQLMYLKQHLSEIKNIPANTATDVIGSITRSDGTPVANVGVFLREEADINHSIRENELYQQVTDEQGTFQFHNVIPGSYQLFLGFTYEQLDGWTWPIEMDDWIDVDGKNEVTHDITLHELIDIQSPVNQEVITEEEVTFAWERVKEASSYSIDLGIETESGSITTRFKSHLTDHSITVPIEELYAQPVGLVFSNEDDIEPKSILAFTHTDNRFFWSVHAYNSKGEKISSSLGHRISKETMGDLPFFYLKERELTEADRLLLKKKIPEALKTYQKNYENNPEDMHSLRMLSRLIGIEEREMEENERTIQYLVTLAENNAASSSDLFMIAHHYFDTQKWNLFQKWFSQYVDMVGEVDGYDQAIYASSLMKQGKLEKAGKQFQEALSKDKSNRFVGYWIATELYLNHSFETPSTIAQKYPERLIGEKPTDWHHLVQKLKAEAQQDDSYQNELRKALDLFFQDEEEELQAWSKKTDHQALKQFINALKKVE